MKFTVAAALSLIGVAIAAPFALPDGDDGVVYPDVYNDVVNQKRDGDDGVIYPDAYNNAANQKRDGDDGVVYPDVYSNGAAITNE